MDRDHIKVDRTDFFSATTQAFLLAQGATLDAPHHLLASCYDSQF